MEARMGKVTFETIEASVSPELYAKLYPGDMDGGYENCANNFVKTLLAVARREPVAFREALDAFRSGGSTSLIDKLLTTEERKTHFEGQWGLTGFQWGWAVNTAAYLLEQAPVPNPAILTLRLTEAEA